MADRRFTVVVERCGVVTLGEEQPPGPVRDGQFDVETIFSGLSTGTDLSWVKGTNPALHRNISAVVTDKLSATDWEKGFEIARAGTGGKVVLDWPEL